METRSCEAPMIAIERGLKNRARSVRIEKAVGKSAPQWPRKKAAMLLESRRRAIACAATDAMQCYHRPSDEYRYRNCRRAAEIVQGRVADFRRPRPHPLVHRYFLPAPAAHRQRARPL